MECGSVTLDWPALRALGDLADKVYCETHDTWHPIWKRATAAEAVGLVIPEPQELLFDEPPF